MAVFRRYIENIHADVSVLPLIHMSDQFSADLIFASGKLTPQPCSVFGRRILYSFYARPAFRSHAGATPSRLQSLRPVCFILDYSKVGTPTNIFPFDTGAFHNGLYARAMHPRMKKEEFALGGTIENAKKVVTEFFGSNESYVLNSLRPNYAQTSQNYYVESYAALIGDALAGNVDERASAIEVQFENEIELSSACIAVVASGRFLSTNAVSKFCPRATVIPYDEVGRQSGAWSGSIYTKVLEYYRGGGML